MIISSLNVESGVTLECTVAIVGAGAAGISLALELAGHGIDVIVLEGGSRKLVKASQDLMRGEVDDPKHHAPLHEGRHRQLGGTTTVWGGRCLPLDEIDFEQRDYVPFSGWPISYAELLPYYPKAMAYCKAGEFDFDARTSLPGHPAELIPGFADGDVISSTVERWGPPVNFGREYYHALKKSRDIQVILNANCTRLVTTEDGGEIASLKVATLGGKRFNVTARRYVVAGGGLESTRLLMASDPDGKGLVGNHTGWLGRGYIGHIPGSIGRVVFNGAPDSVQYDYELSRDGIYVRRRMWISPETQKANGIRNFVAELDNPEKYDASHGSGPLSVAYLALRMPIVGDLIAPGYQKNLALGKTESLNKAFGTEIGADWKSHAKNVIRDAAGVFAFLPGFAYKRFIAKPRIPGFIVKSRNNIYNLKYYAEQEPNKNSRVMLSSDRDALGMPRLKIEYRVTENDLASIVSAHEIIAKQLSDTQCGRLEFKTDDPLEDARRQYAEGTHQLGTTRMAESQANGVVDSQCKVFGVENLYIASSSVFPTSGQANPTLTIVALAVRMAEHLRGI